MRNEVTACLSFGLLLMLSLVHFYAGIGYLSLFLHCPLQNTHRTETLINEFYFPSEEPG
jgi:hypothetical protein